MPPQNNGKVIVSLLAGATAGVVAGLLLAPETGEATRKSLSEGADKLWNGPAGQFLKDALARFTGPATPEFGTPAHTDQQAADSLLRNMDEPGDETEFPAGRAA